MIPFAFGLPSVSCLLLGFGLCSLPLPGIGTDGQYANNCWRDLMRLVGKSKLCEPHTWKMPVVHPVLGFFHRNTSMCAPHLFLGSLYRNYPRYFTRYVFPGVETCREFWLSVRNGEQFRNHPVRDKPDFMNTCFPLKLHGDGTPCVGVGKGWRQMLDIYSMSSILVRGEATRACNFMIWCVHQTLLCMREGHHSMNSRASSQGVSVARGFFLVLCPSRVASSHFLLFRFLPSCLLSYSLDDLVCRDAQ